MTEKEKEFKALSDKCWDLMLQVQQLYSSMEAMYVQAQELHDSATFAEQDTMRKIAPNLYHRAIPAPNSED